MKNFIKMAALIILFSGGFGCAAVQGVGNSDPNQIKAGALDRTKKDHAVEAKGAGWVLFKISIGEPMRKVAVGARSTETTVLRTLARATTVVEEGYISPILTESTNLVQASLETPQRVSF